MWKLLVVPVCSKSWMAAAKTMARISSSLSQCCVEMHRHVALSLSLCQRGGLCWWPYYSNVVSVTMSPVCNIRKWAVCVTSAAWIRLWYGFLYLLYPTSSASTNCTRAWTGIWKHSTTDSKETLNWKLYTAEQLVCAQLKGYTEYVRLSFSTALFILLRPPITYPTQPWQFVGTVNHHDIKEATCNIY